MAEILCKYGANLNLFSLKNSYPLYCAVENNSIEIVEILCRHGAELNSKLKYGYTPLYCAVN